MIPKTIHYCWFGGKEKPMMAMKCIASWKRVCPDFEFVEWNESNFDVSRFEYTQYCYDHQKWAFLSDFVRLWIIYQYGGIYYDVDVELIKSPERLLENSLFLGFETEKIINTGLGFGAVKQHPFVLAMLNEYSLLNKDSNGDYQLMSCPQLNTQALVSNGLKTNGKMQKIGDAIILPIEYLNPYDYATGVLRKTENTMSIHWYSMSWISKKSIIRSKLMRPLHRIFGKDCFARFRKWK